MGKTATALPSAGVAVGSAARGATAPTRGGEGRGHIVSPRAQLVVLVNEINGDGDGENKKTY